MNLEKSNENKTEKKSTENTDLNKKNSYSHTPQPSMKNVSNDMVKIIEEEINHIADTNKERKKMRTYFFGVNKNNKIKSFQTFRNFIIFNFKKLDLRRCCQWKNQNCNLFQ